MTTHAHARAIRARLRNPPNAVLDRGIDLGGNAIALALAENMQRKIIEALQFADEVTAAPVMRRGRSQNEQ